MGDFLFYLLKSGCYLIIFYLLFKTLMSGTTFFRFNRVTLLAGIIGCIFLPLIEFTTEKETFLTVPLQTIQGMLIENEVDASLYQLQSDQLIVDETGSAQALNWCPIVLRYLYLVGGIFTLFWILLSFYRMLRLIQTGEKRVYEKYKLIIVPEPVSSFSWGNYIVVSASDYSHQIDEILLHETMHLRYRHTLDLLLMQLLLVFYWFNPAIWLLKRELQEVHEFEADNGVLNEGINATRYQLLLVKKAVGTRLYSMANGFNHSKLKKRITMMLKERTNRWARLKLLFVVPVMAGALYAFAQPQVKEKLNPIVEEVNLQGQEDSYLELKQFFKKEWNAYQDRTKGKLRKGSITALYMNKSNKLFINNDCVKLEDLKSLLEEKLYSSWKNNRGFVEVLTCLFDDKANQEEMGKVLMIVKSAYTGVREKIAMESSDHTKAYLDSVLPILVNQSSPRLYAQEKARNSISGLSIKISDSSVSILQSLHNPSLDHLERGITKIKELSIDPENIVVTVKTDKNFKEELLTDIKQVLRDCNVLKVNYYATGN